MNWIEFLYLKFFVNVLFLVMVFFLCCKVYKKNLSINLCFKNQIALSLDQFLGNIWFVLMMNNINNGFSRGSFSSSISKGTLIIENHPEWLQVGLEWNKYGQIKHDECRLISKIKMSSTGLYRNVYSIEWNGHAHLHILNECFVTVKWMPAYFPENDYDQFIRNVCMLFCEMFVFKDVLIKLSWFLPLIVGYFFFGLLCVLVTCESVFWWEI